MSDANPLFFGSYTVEYRSGEDKPWKVTNPVEGRLRADMRFAVRYEALDVAAALNRAFEQGWVAGGIEVNTALSLARKRMSAA